MSFFKHHIHHHQVLHHLTAHLFPFPTAHDQPWIRFDWIFLLCWSLYAAEVDSGAKADIITGDQ